jgi:hypothetical protein
MLEAGRARVFAVPLVVAISLAAAVLLAGCGDTVIDSAKTEDAIEADLEKTFHEKIKSVDCPSDQKVEAGSTFTCAVEYTGGEQATATLKIRNEDADVSFVGLKTNK